MQRQKNIYIKLKFLWVTALKTGGFCGLVDVFLEKRTMGFCCGELSIFVAP